MVLAQTNNLLSEIGEHFYGLGLRFLSKVNGILPNNIIKGYRIWTRLNKGAIVSSEEAKIVYEELLSYHAKHVAFGYSSGKTLDKVKTVNLEDLKKDHGLLVTGSWEQFIIYEDVKNYMKNLLNRRDNLMTNSRIEILTFHGSKGKECDNVVWFPDYGAENEVKPYRGACDNPDVQHRLVFVGITRAKQRLYIMAPLYDNYYTIGNPITWET